MCPMVFSDYCLFFPALESIERTIAHLCLVFIVSIFSLAFFADFSFFTWYFIVWAKKLEHSRSKALIEHSISKAHQPEDETSSLSVCQFFSKQRDQLRSCHSHLWVGDCASGGIAHRSGVRLYFTWKESSQRNNDRFRRTANCDRVAKEKHI